MSKKETSAKITYKVIQSFKDKDSKKEYEIGAPYDATAKRLKFLQEKGFIEVVKLNDAGK